MNKFADLDGETPGKPHVPEVLRALEGPCHTDTYRYYIRTMTS